MDEPTLAEWLELSDEERASRLLTWNPYNGEAEGLIGQIADRFRSEYGHLAGLQIVGYGVYHGGAWVIGASHPFVFDRRALPNQFLGVEVRASVRPPLPPEFETREAIGGYVWSPPNFERFVDRCSNQIRQQLGDPGMTRSEMLHALIGRPFEEHLEACRAWVRQGRIPPFEP